MLSKTLYFCEKPAQRWSQLREIDSQALFFVSFSNNFLLSWRLILFLPLLFFVCLLPFACLLSACFRLLASCLLASVCWVLYAAAVQLPLPLPSPALPSLAPAYSCLRPRLFSAPSIIFNNVSPSLFVNLLEKVAGNHKKMLEMFGGYW